MHKCNWQPGPGRSLNRIPNLSPYLSPVAGASDLPSETRQPLPPCPPGGGAPPMPRPWPWVGGTLNVLLAAFILLGPATETRAQWEIEESHTTASLRGIHDVGGGVAWASGTNGTVLRTEDGGYLWQTCAIPPGAEKLDFRAIQAFDENTAIVMSSGPGDQSRLYKTTDGCQTWKLLFTNPDKDGFWDALKFTAVVDPMAHGKCFGTLLGDPISNHFTLFVSLDCGATWERQKTLPVALPSEGAFAASNSSLLTFGSGVSSRIFVTGGRAGARYLSFSTYVDSYPPEGQRATNPPPYEINEWLSEKLPGSDPDDAAGAFALYKSKAGTVVVGGNYGKPDQRGGTAWYRGKNPSTERYAFLSAETPPYGYRSAVAYDAANNTWITVGPNGTDVSTDDGRNWRSLTPTPRDAPRRRQELERPLASLRRRPPRPHRQAPHRRLACLFAD